MFECPALSALRAEYSDLFGLVGGPDVITEACLSSVYTGGFVQASQMHSTAMREFMDQQPGRVASFIHSAFELRGNLPDVLQEVVLNLDGPEFQLQPAYMDTFSSDDWSVVDAGELPPDSQEWEDEWVEVALPVDGLPI